MEIHDFIPFLEEFSEKSLEFHIPLTTKRPAARPKSQIAVPKDRCFRLATELHRSRHQELIVLAATASRAYFLFANPTVIP